MTTGGHDETFRHTMAISYRHDDGNGVVEEVLGLELNEHRLGHVQPTYSVRDMDGLNIIKHRPQSHADVTLSFSSESYHTLSSTELSQLLRIQCRARSAILFFLFEFVECLLGMFSNVILSHRWRCLRCFCSAPNKTEQHHCHASHNSSIINTDHLRPLLSHLILRAHIGQIIPPVHQNTISKFQSLTLRNRDGMLPL